MFFMPIGNPRWPPPQYIDFEHFPIGSNVNLRPAMAAILDFRLA
jgi:hypothetical protein